MKKVQVIGLPGSGKTTAIEIYRERALPFSYIDIRDFEGRQKEFMFMKAIQSQAQDTIAESACGISISGTYIIKLQIPRALLTEHLARTDIKMNKKYMQYLLEQTLPANYTVSTSQDLIELLTNVFQRY